MSDTPYLQSIESTEHSFIIDFEDTYSKLIARKTSLQDSINAIFTSLFHSAQQSSTTQANTIYTESKKDISPTAQYDKAGDISLPLNTTNDYKALLDSIPTPPPQGWEVKTLDEICEINPRIDFKELAQLDREISFLPMEAVKTDGKTFDKLQRNAKEAKGFTKFANGDLLWAKITPCMQNKKSLVAKGLQEGYGFGSTEFFILRARDRRQVDMQFVLQFLRLDMILQRACKSFKGSAGQQRVPKEFLQSLQIPLPPLSVQEQIVTAIESIESKIDCLREQSAGLDSKKSGILQRFLES